MQTPLFSNFLIVTIFQKKVSIFSHFTGARLLDSEKISYHLITEVQCGQSNEGILFTTELSRLRIL